MQNQFPIILRQALILIGVALTMYIGWKYSPREQERLLAQIACEESNRQAGITDAGAIEETCANPLPAKAKTMGALRSYRIGEYLAHIPTAYITSQNVDMPLVRSIGLSFRYPEMSPSLRGMRDDPSHALEVVLYNNYDCDMSLCEHYALMRYEERMLFDKQKKMRLIAKIADHPEWDLSEYNVMVERQEFRIFAKGDIKKPEEWYYCLVETGICNTAYKFDGNLWLRVSFHRSRLAERAELKEKLAAWMREHFITRQTTRSVGAEG